MLAALRSLTVRGRAFLASGLTAVVCGVVLLERDLVRIGVLAVALPLVAAGYVATRSHHLRLHREVSPDHVSLGDTATVRVRVENGGAPTGVLLMEEGLGGALGKRPRFVVSPMDRDGRDLLEYTVRPEARGRHQLGPMEVRQREPFGMVERRQEVAGTAPLLVLPRVDQLSAIRLDGSWFTAGEDQARSFSVGRVADVIVREYRRGDDLRRVHWRSTARMGELMVRNEEQLWQARAVVLLDNRASSHRGADAGSSLEAAVSAAASVSVHLSDLGYTVRLVTCTGRTETWHERGRPQDPYPVLETLATLQTSPDDELPDIAVDEELAGSVIVGILGATRREDRTWWGRFPRRSSAALAITLDVEGWGQRGIEQGTGSGAGSGAGSGDDAGANPPWLIGQGWRTAALGKGRPVADAWRELEAR